MNIYYARLVKKFSSFYTVYSNVENATVLFDGQQVGVIKNGECVVEIDFDVAKDSYAVTLQGGNLSADILNYSFSVTPTSLNFGSAGGTQKVAVSSSLITTKYKHTSGTVLREGSITLNETTYEVPSTPSYTPSSTGSGFSVSADSITANSNENTTSTTVQRTGKVTYIQAGSGKQVVVNLTQAGRTVVTYTVNYPWNGAEVYFDSVKVGTIANGKLVVYKFDDEAKASYSVTFKGGTTPANTHDYTLTVPSSMSFVSAGETKTPSISSIDRVGAPVHNTGVTVSKNSSVDAIYGYTYSEVASPYTIATTGTGFGVSGVNIVAQNNESAIGTTPSRTGTATVRQTNSGKTGTISLTQAGRTMYKFTVISNCNGGSVYANDILRGTISGGKLEFWDASNAAKTVRISGGVPSTSTSRTPMSDEVENGTDYDYTTDWDCSVSKTSFSWNYTGGSGSASVRNSKRDGSRSRSKSRSRSRTNVATTTYSAPANSTVSAGSSVTMNYSSSTSNSTEYGSWSSYSYGSWSGWSYGSWQYSTPTVSAQSNWAPGSINGSSEPWTLNISCSQNTSTSSRTDYFNVNLLNGTVRVNLSQSGKPNDVYVLEFNDTTATTTRSENECYKADAKNPYDADYTGWWRIRSTLNGNDYSSLSGSGTAVTSGGATVNSFVLPGESPLTGGRKFAYKFPVNNTANPKGPYTAILTQTGSGKKLTVNGIYLCGVVLAVQTSAEYSGNGETKSLNVSCNNADFNIPSGISRPTGPTWSVKSVSQSWCTATKNGNNLKVTVAANTSTSSRSCVITLQNNYNSITVTHTVNQAALFSITYNGTAYTSNFNASLGTSTGLSGNYPSFTCNKACNVTVVSQPASGTIGSLTLPTGSKAAGATFQVKSGSNTKFTSQRIVLRCTPTGGGSAIDITITMNPRDNALSVKSASGGPFIFSWVNLNTSLNFSPGHVTNLNANTLGQCRNVVKDYTGSTTGYPFDSSTDSFNTNRTFYVYRFNSNTRKVTYHTMFTGNSTGEYNMG